MWRYKLNIIDLLLRLQNIDREIITKKRDFKQLKSTIENAGGVNQAKIEMQEAKKVLEQSKVKVALLESDRLSHQERMTTVRARLYSGVIKNEREMQALQSEYESAKAKFEETKFGVTDLKRASLKSETKLKTIVEKIKALEIQWSQKQKKIVEDITSVAEELTSLSKRRKSISAKVPADTLNQYNKLITLKRGKAVVKIHRGTCQGCNVRLPISEIANVKLLDMPAMCSICGCILIPS